MMVTFTEIRNTGVTEVPIEGDEWRTQFGTSWIWRSCGVDGKEIFWPCLFETSAFPLPFEQTVPGTSDCNVQRAVQAFLLVSLSCLRLSSLESFVDHPSSFHSYTGSNGLWRLSISYTETQYLTSLNIPCWINLDLQPTKLHSSLSRFSSSSRIFAFSHKI